jgi:hypothetical protein
MKKWTMVSNRAIARDLLRRADLDPVVRRGLCSAPGMGNAYVAVLAYRDAARAAGLPLKY